MHWMSQWGDWLSHRQQLLRKSRGSRGSPVLSCPLSNPMIPHCSHLPSLTSESWLKPLCGKTWGGREMERGREKRKRHLKGEKEVKEWNEER